MDNRWLVVGTIGTALAVAGMLQGMAAQDRVKERNALMQLKLANSQLVLSGVATADFKQIEEGGENLVRLSKKAEFQMAKVADYERLSEEFRRSAEALVQASRNKNIDGAALAYVDLTRSCVKCHQRIRENK